MCGERYNESQFESLEEGKQRFAERKSANRKLLAKNSNYLRAQSAIFQSSESHGFMRTPEIEFE